MVMLLQSIPVTKQRQKACMSKTSKHRKQGKRPRLAHLGSGSRLAVDVMPQHCVGLTLPANGTKGKGRAGEASSRGFQRGCQDLSTKRGYKGILTDSTHFLLGFSPRARGTAFNLDLASRSMSLLP